MAGRSGSTPYSSPARVAMRSVTIATNSSSGKLSTRLPSAASGATPYRRPPPDRPPPACRAPSSVAQARIFAFMRSALVSALARTPAPTSRSAMPGRVFVVRVGDRDHAHLLRREPDREVGCIVLDQEADQPLVRAQRRAVDAQRRLLCALAVRERSG